MDNLKFPKQFVLEKMKENREAHRAAFLKAQEGFRKAAIEQLDEQLKRAREGKEFRLHIQLPIPTDHTKDYDRVIMMIENAVANEIELAEHEFQMYIQDEWQWRREFAATSNAYGVRGKGADF